MSNDLVNRLRDRAASYGSFAIVHEAADEIERLREALCCIGRMKLFPDDRTNRMTLAAAVNIARAALEQKP